MTQIDSVFVPQQDDLGKIRALVSALERGVSRDDLGEAAGLSRRHVRYTLQAARTLGLTQLDGDAWSLTDRAGVLLRTPVGSEAERAMWESAVSGSPALSTLVPELLDPTELKLQVVAARLMERCGLSLSTAVRRAMTLLAWRDALLPQPDFLVDDDEEEVSEIVVVPEPGYEREFVSNPVDDEGQILMF